MSSEKKEAAQQLNLQAEFDDLQIKAQALKLTDPNYVKNHEPKVYEHFEKAVKTFREKVGKPSLLSPQDTAKLDLIYGQVATKVMYNRFTAIDYYGCNLRKDAPNLQNQYLAYQAEMNSISRDSFDQDLKSKISSVQQYYPLVDRIVQQLKPLSDANEKLTDNQQFYAFAARLKNNSDKNDKGAIDAVFSFFVAERLGNALNTIEFSLKKTATMKEKTEPQKNQEQLKEGTSRVLAEFNTHVANNVYGLSATDENSSRNQKTIASARERIITFELKRILKDACITPDKQQVSVDLAEKDFKERVKKYSRNNNKYEDIITKVSATIINEFRAKNSPAIAHQGPKPSNAS